MIALNIPLDLIEAENLSKEFLSSIKAHEVLIFER